MLRGGSFSATPQTNVLSLTRQSHPSSSEIYHTSRVKISSSLPEMLWLIGLGLADETDITVKGLEVVKRAERVYLEAYTSILLVDKEKLVGPLSSVRSEMLII